MTINMRKRQLNFAGTEEERLLEILSALGITSHDEAIQYDEYVEKLYSQNVVKDIIAAIANAVSFKEIRFILSTSIDNINLI